MENCERSGDQMVCKAAQQEPVADLPLASSGIYFLISRRYMGITWGDNDEYWITTSTENARFGEVAYLKEVWWFHVDGSFQFNLPSGTYTVSLRLKLDENQFGWDAAPVIFTLDATDNPRIQTQRNLVNYEEAADPKNSDGLTPIRPSYGGWTEYDVGDFVVGEGESDKPTSIQFVMEDVTEPLAGKGGLYVDCVVIQSKNV